MPRSPDRELMSPILLEFGLDELLISFIWCFTIGQPIPDLPSQTLARVYSYSANGTGDVAMSIQRTDAAMEINEDDIWKYDADHGLQLVAQTRRTCTWHT